MKKDLNRKKKSWEKEDYKRGRLRGKQGSFCFVPAVFGIFMAYLAIEHITK